MSGEPAKPKMGRPRADPASQAARGTQRYRDSQRGKAKPEPPVKLLVDDPPKLPETRAQWRKLLKSLPGYDPYRYTGGAKFDPDTAIEAINFFHNQLTHVKGRYARKPFYLERWQMATIANLFGWIRPDGTRRFRKLFLFVPRKNGKTPMAAGLILKLLTEGEPGAEVYGAASGYKQASLVFQHARGMVLQDPKLNADLKIYNSTTDRSIQLKSDYSTYSVICAESSSLHGFNSHGYVVDEVHTLPVGSELIDTMETSTGARLQPLSIYLTTSDYERPGSQCNDMHEYACKVRDGEIDDAEYLPVIYEASIDDDWHSERVWRKANPNYGISITEDYFNSAYRKAKQSPRFLNIFKRLHLNIRTESVVRWINMDDWDACCGDVDPDELKGSSCYGGLDLAASSDMTCFIMMFPFDGQYKFLPFFWLPRRALQHESDGGSNRSRDAVALYQKWEAAGLIKVTETDVTDYGVVREDLLKLAEIYHMKSIAVDRLFQGVQLSEELAESGLDMVAFGQGFMSMAAPTLGLETALIGHTVEHGGNPILRWHAQNICVDVDAAGNMKPSKKGSANKIDGIVTMIMAYGIASVCDDLASPGIL